MDEAEFADTVARYRKTTPQLPDYTPCHYPACGLAEGHTGTHERWNIARQEYGPLAGGDGHE